MAEGGEKKNVVVIGGGVAGSVVAKTLQNDVNVSLIDESHSWDYTGYVVVVRFMCVPYPAKIGVMGDKVCMHPTLPRFYPWDYTGYVVVVVRFMSVPTLLKYEKIKAADSILIVGGGPTGVELAAEIVADFPAKKVTLVHRGSRLLEFIGESASKKALNWLTSKKVEVILEQSVVVNSQSNGVYRTSGGETIVADCYFLCTGTLFGSAWLKETILKDSLDSRGRVMVDSNLRIKGHNNIFAIGDITDVPELKQGYLAQEHAKVVAKNITTLVKGVEDDHKLAVYKPATKALAIVSLGRKDAVAQFPCLSIAGRVPGMIKSGDLFVGKTRKGLGLQPGV
ncbi:hypothetical protein KY284_007333 [Solanum tuberosum]|nr:hypothetical protein KY284_007333 [Solanum tuberosum]